MEVEIKNKSRNICAKRSKGTQITDTVGNSYFLLSGCLVGHASVPCTLWKCETRYTAKANSNMKPHVSLAELLRYRLWRRSYGQRKLFLPS